MVRAPNDGFLLEAAVAPADLAAARARLRHVTRAAALGVVALTLLFCTGPIIDLRRQTRDVSRFLTLTAALIVIVVAVRGILSVALSPLAPTPAPTPLDLLLTTLTLAAVVWLVLDLIERRRVARPRLRSPPTAGAVQPSRASVVAGLADGWLLWRTSGCSRRRADTDLDLLHFSLHPLSAARVALEFSLVLLHAAVIWGRPPSSGCRRRCGARRGRCLPHGHRRRLARGRACRDAGRPPVGPPIRWAALGGATRCRRLHRGAVAHQSPIRRFRKCASRGFFWRC